MPTGIAESLTDDQIALIGCLLALLVSGTLMSLSFYIGKGAREAASRAANDQPDLLSLSNTANRPTGDVPATSGKRAA